MQTLHILPSEETPLINFEQGKLTFKGVFYPENVLSFMESANIWLDAYYQSNYFQTKKNVTILDIFLPYMNTASIKVVFDMMIEWEQFYANGHNIKILHRYEDGAQDHFLDMFNDGDFEIPIEHLQI